jgi:signal transduction histidine kinase
VRSKLPSFAESRNPPAPEHYPVLVVEDDDAIRTLVVRRLAAAGYRAQGVASAEAALVVLESMTAPIVLTDQNLPGGMTGLDMVEVLGEKRRDFEAIVMTAYADVAGLTKSLKLGVFRCILKPFHHEEVLASVAGAATRLDLRLHKQDLETRNAELEEKLREVREMQQHQMLAERLTSIGRLAAGVAHEINTPLASVIANLALVGEELSTPSGPHLGQVAEMLCDAREAAERVRVIVRDLKTFSRGDEESMGAIDLRRVIESTVNMAWNEIRHRARLVKDYGTTPEVEANDARLGQVVLNLLLNAVQAIPDGDASRHEIRIVTRTIGNRVVLEVQDTGAGMSAAVIEHIFDPFFTTKPIGIGTGLGLSTCHGIVMSFGGEIEVESVIGKGSVFRVLLPIAKTLALEPPSPSSRPVGWRGRVLAIDDDALFLSTVKRVLSRDHDVVALLSARNALEQIEKGERFDAILCDLMMPDMTGMDLHAVLAETSPENADAIIFLTGGTFTPRAQDFLDRVSNFRLAKPFDPLQVRALIAERLRGR